MRVPFWEKTLHFGSELRVRVRVSVSVRVSVGVGVGGETVD